jgi:hypothetical protein
METHARWFCFDVLDEWDMGLNQMGAKTGRGIVE